MPTAMRQIRQAGYAVIPEVLPSANGFAQAYRAFDAVAKLVSEDELVSLTFEKMEISWDTALARSFFFSGAPMGFRNRALRVDKAKKSYFHYAPPFESFAREQYPTLFSKYPEINELFASAETLWSATVDVLVPLILEHDSRYPGLRRLLIKPRKSPPVILRLIRYEPGAHIESVPHYDKSAFTLHMDSDDAAANQFIIGKWRPTELRLCDLAPVPARTNSKGVMHAVAFPGMFLREMGYPEIKPSPHAALGSEENRYRHVAVGFWLVPYMSTDHLVTDIPLKAA